MDTQDLRGRWFAVLVVAVCVAAALGGYVTGMVAEAVLAALLVVGLAYLNFNYPF